MGWTRVLAGSLALSGSVLLSGCGDQALTRSAGSEPVSAQPTLVVALPAAGVLDAAVTGTLRVNSVGCFTLDDRVLIAPAGSRVLAGKPTIRVVGLGDTETGDTIESGGGYFDSAMVADSATASAVAACLAPDSAAEAVVLTP